MAATKQKFDAKSESLSQSLCKWKVKTPVKCEQELPGSCRMTLRRIRGQFCRSPAARLIVDESGSSILLLQLNSSPLASKESGLQQKGSIVAIFYHHHSWQVAEVNNVVYRYGNCSPHRMLLTVNLTVDYKL